MYHPCNSTIEGEANLTMYRHAKDSLDEELTSRIGEGWQHRDDLITNECEDIRRIYKAWKQARNGIDSTLESLAELEAKENSE